MAIPAFLVQLLVVLGIQLGRAIGDVLARRVQAQYAALAMANPTLKEPAVRETTSLIARIAKDVVVEIEGMAWGVVLRPEERNHLARERAWQEIFQRAVARNIVIDENYARAEAEAAYRERKVERVEDKSAVPILAPQTAKGKR